MPILQKNTFHQPPCNVINNIIGFKILALFSMLYMSIMLCNAILTNRYVGSDTLFILGGTLTSPFIFILNDIIAEIYGYKISKYIIICGFLMQLTFAVICQLVLVAPFPSFFTEDETYKTILGTSLLRITISGFVAYMIATLVNSFLISQWKILLKGKKFWLRSFASSTISEALYSFIAILMMELMSIPIGDILKVILMSYLIKASYGLILAFPVQKLVQYIKNITGIDVYDVPIDFTPFKVLNKFRDNQ